MTGESLHEKRARHIKETWAKRCNGYLFMSSKEDLSLPAINLRTREGYNFTWEKTKAAFEYVHKNFIVGFYRMFYMNSATKTKFF